MGSKQEVKAEVQAETVADFSKCETSQGTAPARIQGSFGISGIGAIGLGERHTKGAKEARRAQQF